MALPPICHWERRSKISALGHIAIGTWTTIGCNGCFSHFPFNKSSDHFIGRNCASHLNRDRFISAGTKASPTKCSQRDQRARVKFRLEAKTKSGLTRKGPTNRSRSSDTIKNAQTEATIAATIAVQRRHCASRKPTADRVNATIQSVDTVNSLSATSANNDETAVMLFAD